MKLLSCRTTFLHRTTTIRVVLILVARQICLHALKTFFRFAAGEAIYEQHQLQERGGTPRIPSVPPSPCRSIPVASSGLANLASPARKLTMGGDGLRGPHPTPSGLPGADDKMSLMVVLATTCSYVCKCRSE
jgi:hypothetical protein